MDTPQDLARILYLTDADSKRLSAWLSQLEPVREINPGRWQQLCDGSTDYISHNELAHLMDVATPCGYALDVIRGTCSVQVQEVPMS